MVSLTASQVRTNSRTQAAPKIRADQMAGKLILHIGATKTGTSAIQSAVARNRATLLANGIYYPEYDADEKAQAGRVTGGNGAIFRALYTEYEESPRKALKK